MQPVISPLSARQGTVILPARLGEILRSPPALYSPEDEQLLTVFPPGITAHEREDSLYLPCPQQSIIGLCHAFTKKPGRPMIDLTPIHLDAPWLREETPAGWLRIDWLPQHEQRLKQRELTAREATLVLLALYADKHPLTTKFLAIVTGSKAPTGQHVVVRLHNHQISYNEVAPSALNVYNLRFSARLV